MFTLFVVALTLSQFPSGWVRDRWGPRLPLMVGALLLAVGYLGAAWARSPLGLAAFYTVGGMGAGAAYTVAVNTPVKWFDERQGLATGVVVMAFGGLSFLLVPTVRRTAGSSLDPTLVGLGLFAGATALAAAVLLRDPPAATADGATPSGADRSTQSGADGDATDAGDDPPAVTHAAGAGRASPWRQTVRTWQFWLLYAVFVVVNSIGVMVIGKAVVFAQALDLTAAVATGSASIIAVSDAVGVLVGSGASDRFGRERTAGVAVMLTGVALAGAVVTGVDGNGLAFVVLLGVTAFFRSPAFAIFPVLVGEYYGKRHSSTNYAALLTAKVWGRCSAAPWPARSSSPSAGLRRSWSLAGLRLSRESRRSCSGHRNALAGLTDSTR